MKALPFLAFLLCLALPAAADISQLDRNMAIPVVREEGVVWYSPFDAPFRLGGFGYPAENRTFRRLPRRPEGAIPAAVDRLADNTAGGQVAFRSNARRVLVRVKLAGKRMMFHMAPTGASGFDLYTGAPGEKKFWMVSRMKPDADEYQAVLYSGKQREWNEFTINFPLYNGVKELLIGVDDGAELAAPSPYARPERIVIYGGSTVQGACASRPGAYHMNIVSRELNMEVINLGFSGSGKMEPEMAQLIAEIERPAVFIIEAERNTGLANTRTRLEPFIRILKEKHPAVPVVIMSANKRANETRIPGNRPEILAFMKELTAKLKAENVHLFDSSELLGDDFYECSVDGTHPTDLGFSRMAQGLTPYLRDLLKLENTGKK